jgi:glycosyltransferase involved in cell wall biosynthesis/GT2 family glycosyltransferase
MERFVCAFRGRRDAYQVPLALAEGDLLETFITDAYATPLAKIAGGLASERTRSKLERRREPGIPDERVTCLWGTALLEQTNLFLGQPALLTLKRYDRRFSLAAAEMARRTRAHLFLYSPYAWEAFTARYAHSPRRVMFQYHPHPEMERRLIEEDRARYPGFGESFSEEHGSTLPEDLFRRESEAWRHADLIFCASRFTLRSLLEAGCDESRCRVVPYGIDVPPVPSEGPPYAGFHVVFVGSGGQRKGLHHLLMAWKNAAMPPNSRLTLVCRVMDEGIESLAEKTPRVEIRRGVSADKLPGLYARSHLFAMPSLVEGFGQVYLEALAQGCPVLGTTHTALPDLGTEADGVFLTPVSNVDALTARLEELAKALPEDRAIRLAARATAARFTWPAFRTELRRSLLAEGRAETLSERIELRSQEPRQRVAISAIVTAYERPDMILRTVRCLKECQPAPSEILVHVDGDQTALAEQLREAFPDITVLASKERLGPGGARNLLLRSAKEELVASFDDDSRPVSPDYFQRAFAAAQTFPDAAVLTATLLDGSEDAVSASERPSHVATFAGGACVYRKSIFFETTGYVPLALAYGMEEVDLSLRLHAIGKRVVHVPDLRVVHEAPLKNVRRIVFNRFWPRLVTAQDPGHRDTREIAAGTVANLALLPFLRYPVVLWPYGTAQCLHKVLELMCNGRTREALAGLWSIPGHLWRHRHERAPLTVAQVRSYLRLRRHGSDEASQKSET